MRAYKGPSVDKYHKKHGRKLASDGNVVFPGGVLGRGKRVEIVVLPSLASVLLYQNCEKSLSVLLPELNFIREY